MRKPFAIKVANLLGAVELILVQDGRPRKLPGKDRAVGLTDMGQPVAKVNKRNVWTVDKLSLLGAFQVARLQLDYSNKVMAVAMQEFIRSYTGIASWHLEGWELAPTITSIDNHQLDTRRLARDAKAARRLIEQAYGIDAAILRSL